jgi:hypothetical protein
MKSSPKSALVLGGAANVWADASEALALFTPDAIAAVNDIGTRWAGPIDLWCSLHEEKFPRWIAERARRCFPRATQHVANGPAPGIDSIEFYPWPGMNASGSSGLYAVKLLMDRGFEKIVLAGVPMDAQAAHFFDPARWDEVDAFWQTWIDQVHRLRGIVKSMSGRTKELLGTPSREWLGATASFKADTQAAA